LNYTEISNKADEEFDLGRIKEAISLLKKGLDIAREKGHKSYIEFFLGELENVKGDYESGLTHHKQAVKLNPKNQFLLKNLGVTYSFLGKEEEAIELYDRALEIKPDDYDSLREKGVSLSKLGKEELREKGVSLSKLGKEEEAIELFDRALEIKPDDYDSLRNKGVSLSELGKGEEAIELFDRALEIKSDDWNALIWKAYTLENIDRNKDAENIYKNLQLNFHKIKDKKLKDLINFKIGIYEKTKSTTPEEAKKSSDILNKVINAFQDKKNDFFESINKIESEFKTFTDTERSIPNDFPSFLSILRKWNSYTPIIPSEKGDNKGGGYFLYHKGKGIVIDPGFNFIENFYQEGFKVADIDAILITHAHNDQIK
jgi:tetratricopeptide (TPR) repeat protein